MSTKATELVSSATWHCLYTAVLKNSFQKFLYLYRDPDSHQNLAGCC